MEITDTLPAQLQYVSSNGNWDGSMVTWTIGSLAPGVSGTVTLSVFAPESAEGEKVINTAYATYAAASGGPPRAPETAEHEIWVLTEPAFYVDRNIFNPFEPDRVKITWRVPAKDGMFLGVYNSAGELIRMLKRGRAEIFTMGEVFWDGRNEEGDIVASGVYIIYLSGSRAFYAKVAVVK